MTNATLPNTTLPNTGQTNKRETKRAARARSIAMLGAVALGALATVGCDIDGFRCFIEGKPAFGMARIRTIGSDGTRKTHHGARIRARQSFTNAIVEYKAPFFPTFEFDLNINYDKLGPETNTGRFSTFGFSSDGISYSIVAQLGDGFWQTSLFAGPDQVLGTLQQHSFSGERPPLQLRLQSTLAGDEEQIVGAWGRLRDGDPYSNLGEFPPIPGSSVCHPAFGGVNLAKKDSVVFSGFHPNVGSGFAFAPAQELEYRVACAQAALERGKFYADTCPPSWPFTIQSQIVAAESETNLLLTEFRVRFKGKKKSPQEKAIKNAEKLLKLYPKAFAFVGKKKTPSGKAVWNKLNSLEKRLLKLVEFVDELEDDE